MANAASHGSARNAPRCTTFFMFLGGLVQHAPPARSGPPCMANVPDVPECPTFCIGFSNITLNVPLSRPPTRTAAFAHPAVPAADRSHAFYGSRNALRPIAAVRKAARVPPWFHGRAYVIAILLNTAIRNDPLSSAVRHNARLDVFGGWRNGSALRVVAAASRRLFPSDRAFSFNAELDSAAAPRGRGGYTELQG